MTDACRIYLHQDFARPWGGELQSFYAQRRAVGVRTGMVATAFKHSGGDTAFSHLWPNLLYGGPLLLEFPDLWKADQLAKFIEIKQPIRLPDSMVLEVSHCLFHGGRSG